MYRVMQVNPSPLELQDNPLDMPARTLTSSQVTDMNLKYYNSDIHRAAFVLPVFFQKVSAFHLIFYAMHVSPEGWCCGCYACVCN